MPKPTPYVPHPDYDTLEYTSQYHSVHPCYLDKDKSVSIPDIYAYDGVVQGQPKPLTGSHSLLGLREDICFDRFGRYGPYGLGYPSDEGGLQIGLDTENSTSDGVWEKTGKINYDNIDWGDVQDRCFESNKKRFHGPDGQTDATSWLFPKRQKISRTAVVVRAYTDYPWSYHGILNIRALISELALRSGGEYHVHFLLHVRNNTEPIWGDNATVQRILVENVPEEFHSLCTLWSEAQMRLIYPGDFSRSFSNPSNLDIFGVYRSAHLPLQHFAVNHPEYDFFWNWELDIRYIGNYYELFERLGEWAKNQSRVEIWERSAKYYIPAYHGDWANFTSLVHNETIASGRTPIIGPVDFPGREPLTPNSKTSPSPPPAPPPTSPYPPQTPPRQPITPPPSLLRLPRATPHPPRRSAIITASRLSRRLLAAMHEEVLRLQHTTFSEMFPATVALHHGLKAVYAPHPVGNGSSYAMGKEGGMAA
ncbi:hypothetical protein N0V88_002424 [Collariella sp. IMI 366227]|nr:hypothetical protein N0V88_002424 [Collariella sp. IMI 366227]